MNPKLISFHPAFLWDERKQLSGELKLSTDTLYFYFDNFKDSKLEIQIVLEQIKRIRLYSLYELVNSGLEISDNKERTYIFILNEPKKLKNLIEKKINPT